jgi:hypothetical protein
MVNMNRRGIFWRNDERHSPDIGQCPVADRFVYACAIFEYRNSREFFQNVRDNWLS